MTKREWLGVLQHMLVLFTPLWTDVLAPGSRGAETSSKVADGLVVEQRRLLPAFPMQPAHCRESLREPHQRFLPVVVLNVFVVATWVPQDLEILVATSLDSIFFCGPARTMGEVIPATRASQYLPACDFRSASRQGSPRATRC
uniref:Putative secreted protein n=1 Tax=Ixodes scapularis TaxID=6945 RepID=A0A4D5REK5_IXOSC